MVAERVRRTPRESFPRLNARTRRFTLGDPRNFQVSPKGDRVFFLRSGGGTDAVTCLWSFDVATGQETLLADPVDLLADLEDLPEEETRRRERVREGASGIVAYATDLEMQRACFALGGQLFVTDLMLGETTFLDTEPGVFDPRLDPTGSHVAYVSGNTLRLAMPSRPDRLLVGEDDPDVYWGSAEFIAAEEMGRSRGFWWSPEGDRLAVARVDLASVETWYVGDPGNPAEPPVSLRYPAAGTENADVRLSVVDLEGRICDILWDRDAFPYLAAVDWCHGSPLTLVVQSRDQRTLAVLTADPESGAVEECWRQQDDHWVELVPGAPRWVGHQLVALVDRDDARRVVIDGVPASPAGLQVRGVVGVLDGDLIVTGSTEPTEIHVFRIPLDGSGVELPVAELALTKEVGVHSATVGADVMVLSSASMTRFGSRVRVFCGGVMVGEVGSLAAKPGLVPKGRFHIVGDRKLRSVVLFPRQAADGPLPVLLDIYGGPHAQRVLRSRNAHLTSQWFAEQGFAVVITDGRGTPARGPAWERAVWRDLAQPVLEDQVDALAGLAERDQRLDTSKVAIRGWSFGGYLAALAVLRRPDVFHAAIAGAPVTEWRLYDTHYTERYLGDPALEDEAYDRSSLLVEAGRLTRPLQLIHGLADDNVVAAHSFRFSTELLAAGRSHQVLPLAGVTHMTPQEVVAENLLLLQVAFLRQALSIA